MKAVSTAGQRFMLNAPVSGGPFAAFTVESWVRLAQLDGTYGAFPIAVMTSGFAKLAVGVRAVAVGARWTVLVGDISTDAPVANAEVAFDAPGGTIGRDGHGFSASREVPANDSWVRVSVAVDGTVIELSLDGTLVISLPTTIAGVGLPINDIEFSSVFGDHFSATCDFAGGRLWTRRLTPQEIRQTANQDSVTDHDVPAEWLVDSAVPWIVRKGPAADQAINLYPPGLDLRTVIVDASELGDVPTLSEPIPAPPAQPPARTPLPPEVPTVPVPEGDADRMTISQKLPDNVVHTGRRVVELAVQPATAPKQDVAPSTSTSTSKPLVAPASTPGQTGPPNVISGPSSSIGSGPGGGGGGGGGVLHPLTTHDDYRRQETDRPARTQIALRDDIVLAQTIGYLNPNSFPLMAGSMDGVTMAGVRLALKGVDPDKLATAILDSNSQLVVYPSADGSYLWRLVPPRTATEPRPRLLFIETYSLTSFLGRYGAGRTLKTLTLLPGEKVRMQVRSYHRKSVTSARASSVLDSSSREAESEFERLAMQEDSTSSDIASSFEYHADIEARGDATWGWGSASVDVSGGVKGNSTADRETFAKSTVNALDKHTSRASAAREVSVTTADEVAEESWEEADNERVLENINLSRTLNYVFRQMNQEYLTVLHLTDVRVAYFDGLRESRDEVPLHQAEILIARHSDTLDPASARAEVTREVNAITGTNNLQSDQGFILSSAETRGDASSRHYRVNLAHTSAVTIDGEPAGFTVPGIVLSTNRTVMRTDGVMVDAYIGTGNALDTYSTVLQEQEARRVTLENDQTEAITAILRSAGGAQASELDGYTKLVEAVARFRNGFPSPPLQIANPQLGVLSAPHNGRQAQAPS
ncbi:hypothetical protein [Mumia zhuanghuii]|uniref:hypothetical protein n=1 Tax=Mumia zhuanghuii TaxID=2585211 RepID=UPI0036363976